jgi:hypothetical protein
MKRLTRDTKFYSDEKKILASKLPKFKQNFCSTIRYRTFWQESFWHGCFITGKFWHMHHSALWTFRQMDVSTWERFNVGTFWHREFSARGIFGTGIFWQRDILASWMFRYIPSRQKVLTIFGYNLQISIIVSFGKCPSSSLACHIVMRATKEEGLSRSMTEVHAATQIRAVGIQFSLKRS